MPSGTALAHLERLPVRQSAAMDQATSEVAPVAFWFNLLVSSDV
jgi:hypothetical protein